MHSGQKRQQHLWVILAKLLPTVWRTTHRTTAKQFPAVQFHWQQQLPHWGYENLLLKTKAPFVPVGHMSKQEQYSRLERFLFPPSHTFFICLFLLRHTHRQVLSLLTLPLKRVQAFISRALSNVDQIVESGSCSSGPAQSLLFSFAHSLTISSRSQS